ncbi:MAG: tol-pal system protein YbgF [Candidatus Acidiferrales bacterium]
MRKQTIALLGAAMLAGALGGALFSPAPAEAVAREIIELQQSVTQVLTNQQALQTQMTQNAAVEKTLLDQVTSTINSFNSSIATLQKSVEDLQANSGSSLSTMGTQVQGLADNVADLQARIGKLDQKLADAQNTLQSIDARLAGGAPPTTTEPGAPGAPPADSAPGSAPPTSSEPGTAPPAAMAPGAPSADVLYSNGLRDLTGRQYQLATQEFQDYLKYYGGTDLASNAQFYLGEIAYSQGKFQDAVNAYSKVIENYPKSFKLAPAHLKKGLALIELNQKTNAERELRAVVRLFPGTDEERRARAKLKELGAPVA